MSTDNQALFVKSHVSRDLLQSAALFKNDHLVVWEYVSNGLQYVDSRTSPEVRVRLDDRKKSITIKDNGRGMTFAGLKNFFVMHGENVDRKAGRIGRGMFGTGKSAAFGIAERLVLTTVSDRKRTKVSLSRSDVEAMTDDSPIPVKVVEKETPTAEPNGTLVEIEGVHLPKFDQKRIIAFVERHLAHWPHDVTVWVNNHECQYTAPTAVRTETIEPQGDLAKKLGPCTLVLRVAATPLSEEERGVSVFSKGVWHETTLAGSEGRDMSSFIFGEIDVAALDDDRSPVAPFDMSRSMVLNPANEIVQALFGFIGTNVENLRKELVAEEKARRASEDARRLQKQADEIAKVINDDSSDFRQRVAKARAHAVGGQDLGRSQKGGGTEDDDFIFGHENPAEIDTASAGPTRKSGGGGGGGSDVGHDKLGVKPGKEADPKKGKHVGGPGADRPKPRGGFSIDFRNMGIEQNRAKYHREERQIVINLDHPQFKAALGSSTVEDLTFRRLAYEVAFSEYALALAFELAGRGEYGDVTDPIVDIGETINRVARRAASLYEAP